MLKALGTGELEDLKVDGRLVVTCEFCSASYVFDEEEIAALTPP
jgi:redox-regulated HSP33 family molecular chaperone